MSTTTEEVKVSRKVEEIEGAIVRFAGDSGDGMQLAGTQFTTASVVSRNDVSTLPDFPAEIRAPAGSLAGVSGFQIHFSSNQIYTPGDLIDALFAMNPAALKSNIEDLKKGGLLVVNSDAFTKDGLERAGYESNPLEDGSLKKFHLVPIPITKITREAVESTGLDRKAQDRCKNFLTLGLAYWVYGRPLEPTIEWLKKKFSKNPPILEANLNALNAGYYYGETVELFTSTYNVKESTTIEKGTYRKVTGNEALAIGFIAASRFSSKSLFYGSYPITPASEILHELSAMKKFDVVTFQAEDEIAAVCAALGAAFGGSLAVTGTSGPGVALKTETIGLGVMTELPLVVVNVQRGGPSTGLPTKTEQADLFQAIYGRNGECPVPVVAPKTPADCYAMAVEASKIALRYMTPVILLSDGYIANGAEPWRIPEKEEWETIDVPYCTESDNFHPYARDERLSRPWAIPGTPNLQHRIGGLEKEHITGNVSYDPQNHEYMVKLRQEKINGIQEEIPLLDVYGDATGELLILGWGSTYGVIQTAVEEARAEGYPVSCAHFRYLNPFPKNTKEVLSRFRKILIPEMNLGQLHTIIRANFLIDAYKYNKIQGKPIRVDEIKNVIKDTLEDQ